MDEAPDRETVQEWVEERDLDRRDVLKGILPVVGAGLIFRNQLPTSSNANSRLTDAEESATALAERINVTDLRDPLLMSGLTPMVEGTIETINEVLHDATVTQSVWIAEKQRNIANVLSVIPGIAPPPTQSRPATRVTRLEAVLTYYQSLNDALQYAASTQKDLATIEFPALYDGARPKQAPTDVLDSDVIETGNDEARKAGEQAVEEVSAESQLPEIEQVAAHITTQVQVQNQLSTAVQAYLDTAEFIETGARKHEQEKLDQARNQFRAAKEAIPEDVLNSDQPYAISHDGPTLRDYRTHFSNRRQGLDQLIAACDSEIDASTQGTLFNEGLSHLIDAREVVRR